MEATLAQMEGRFGDAQEARAASLEFGRVHSCGDAQLSWELHLLSMVQLGGEAADPKDEAAVRAYPVLGPLLLDADPATVPARRCWRGRST